MNTLNVAILALASAVGMASASDLVDPSQQDTLQTLCKVAHMGVAVARELESISTNSAITPDLRAFAAASLKNHNSSGTNTYGQLDAFVKTWAMTNAPTMTSNTIQTMKTVLEYGDSGMFLLKEFSQNTNNAWSINDSARRMIKMLDERPSSQ